MDQAVDNFLAPVAEHRSAMTAARSMGRLLALNPEFATTPHLGWAPHYDGRVSVNGGLLHPESAALMHALAVLLDIEVQVKPSISAKYGEVVTLQGRGFHDGAEWDVWVMVSADQFAEYQRLAAESVVAA